MMHRSEVATVLQSVRFKAGSSNVLLKINDGKGFIQIQVLQQQSLQILLDNMFLKGILVNMCY